MCIPVFHKLHIYLGTLTPLDANTGQINTNHYRARQWQVSPSTLPRVVALINRGCAPAGMPSTGQRWNGRPAILGVVGVGTGGIVVEQAPTFIPGRRRGLLQEWRARRRREGAAELLSQRARGHGSADGRNRAGWALSPLVSPS